MFAFDYSLFCLAFLFLAVKHQQIGCPCYAEVSLFIIAACDWFCGEKNLQYKETRNLHVNRTILGNLPLETTIVDTNKMSTIENSLLQAFRVISFTSA